MTSHLTEEARAYYLDQTPSGARRTLEEVPAVVRFLMSDEASYVNGAVRPGRRRADRVVARSSRAP